MMINGKNVAAEYKALEEIRAILTVCPFGARQQTVLLTSMAMTLKDIRSPISRAMHELSLAEMISEHAECDELLEQLQKFMQGAPK